MTEIENYEVTVTKADERSVGELKFRLMEKPEDEGSGEETIVSG